MGANSSGDAFARTYLDVVAGKPLQGARGCGECHERSEEWPKGDWQALSARAKSGAKEWAAAVQLEGRCGSCHVTPDPRTLPSEHWREVMGRMEEIMAQRGLPGLKAEERRDLLHYYYTYSFDSLPRLAADPDPANSPITFESTVFGRALETNTVERPFIGHLQSTDLDQDGRVDVLVCDGDNASLNWVREVQEASGERTWREVQIAPLRSPARAAVFTNRSTGRLDMMVACQHLITPTDEPIGSVVWVRNDGEGRFAPVTLMTNIGRVASVEPGDFNGDGEMDFAVAMFGHVNIGEVGWLEGGVEGRDGSYSYHTILKRTGAIRAQPVDINKDGALDFVALFGQEHELISAFLNEGKTFREVKLFQAGTPSFGSAGMDLVDLDRDGDLDILYTNGDNMDFKLRIPRPYHGVQWLENRGELNFVYHDIMRFYGAYGAAPADLNGDGHLDIVVTSLFNDWEDPTRASLIWLENDGRQNFTAHGIARRPIQLITTTVADIDEDGAADIIASGMHIFPPFDRSARVTLWRNCGPRAVARD